MMFFNDMEAEFLRRPNRFLIIAGNNGEEIPCHCPNPGRLEEMLFPGVTLILEKRGSSETVKSAAKTGWTAAGLYRRETVVPLFASRANRAAEKLILPSLIPGLKEIRREYTVGGSRFDFLCIDSAGTRHLIEVKACSLVEYDVAMFPDAPSSRALKHLEELAALAGQGYVCRILFVIVHGTPSVFIPNLHTDPEFSAGLSRYSGRVNIHASLLRCNRDGGAELILPSVPVDLSHGTLAAENRGSYLIVLEIPRETEIAVGALGNIRFRKGWYVYAGSAQRNLSGRIARHLRKVRKKKHWHLDYLTPETGTIKAYPICSYMNLECALAENLAALGGVPVTGFGSSDCRCGSHLFYFPYPPERDRAFMEMLFRFRHIEGFGKERGDSQMHRVCRLLHP